MLLYNISLSGGYMRLTKVILTSLIVLAPQLIQAKEIKLLTSIKPLQLIATAIQQDIAQPDVLVPVGTSPHHYALRPNDLQRINNADLFYWIGPDMEIFLTKTIKNRTNETVAIETLPEIQLKHFSDNPEQHDNHDHEHGAGQVDPHLWLSPKNANIVASKMVEDLIKLDPENMQKYQQNLKLFQEQLNKTDKQIKTQLSQIKLKPYFVVHETYDYFENHYGIQHDGVFSLNSSILPGIRQITEMKERLKKTGESCIFYEPPIKPKLINTLSQGLNVNSYMLDAMGAEITVNSNGYPNLLLEIANQLQQCKQ